jgi:hypothetical protein
VKVLGPGDLFEKSDVKTAPEAIKKLKSLLSTKSEPAAHNAVDSSGGARGRAPCVYILSSDAFPETLGQWLEIMAGEGVGIRSEFPIIDGVVSLISRGDQTAKRLVCIVTNINNVEYIR